MRPTHEREFNEHSLGTCDGGWFPIRQTLDYPRLQHVLIPKPERDPERLGKRTDITERFLDLIAVLEGEWLHQVGGRDEVSEAHASHRSEHGACYIQIRGTVVNAWKEMQVKVDHAREVPNDGQWNACDASTEGWCGRRDSNPHGVAPNGV